MNIEQVKNSLRHSALQILKKQLSPDMLGSLFKLASMDGFSNITLAELMEGYNPNPGPKVYGAKELLKTTVGGIRKMVKQFISHHPDTTIPEIARQLNLESTQVTYAIKLLEDNWKVEMMGKVRGRKTYRVYE